jgi:hypothetical protein
MIKLLKPLTGRIIPMPEYNYAPLPEDGMELPLSPYWHARISDGDVVIVETEKKTTKKESV